MILDLERPHGFLVWKGKQKAIPSDVLLDTTVKYLIVQGDEALGWATLGEPVRCDEKEFDALVNLHRTKHYERKMQWPDAQLLFSHEIVTFEKFEQAKHFDVVEGQVVIKDIVELNEREKAFVEQAKELPNKIVVKEGVVQANDQGRVVMNGEFGPKVDDLLIKGIVPAEGDAKQSPSIELYDLALVRNPSMNVKQGFVPPNFVDGGGDESTACGSCLWLNREAAFDGMPLCELFQVYVDESDVCDAWEAADDVEEEVVDEEPITDEEPVEGEEPEAETMLDESDFNSDPSNWGSAEAYCNVSLIDLNNGAMPEEMSADLCMLPIAIDSDSPINSNALGEAVDAIDSLSAPEGVDEDTFEGARVGAASTIAEIYRSILGEEPPANVLDILGEVPQGGTEAAVYKDPKDEEKGMIVKLKNMAAVVRAALKHFDPNNKVFEMSGDSGWGIKESDRGPIFFTWSANAFKDRTQEIFSTAALEKYVAENSQNEDKGTFNFWHIPGTDFAKKEFQAVAGRFLIEAGPFLDNANGRAARKFFKQYPNNHPVYAPEGWGASIEYRYLPEEQMGGVYDWVWVTRTSALPKAMAANINTLGGLKEMATLTQEQIELGREMFGADGFDKIIGDAEAKSAVLEGQVEFKSADDATTEDEVVEAPKTDDDAQNEAPVEGEVDATETEEVDAEAQSEEGAEEEEGQEAPTPVLEDIVKSVTDELAGNLKDELAVIATIPDAINSLVERVEALETGQRVKQIAGQSRFSLFAENKAASVVASKGSDELTESDVEEAGPDQTDPTAIVSPQDHYFGKH